MGAFPCSKCADLACSSAELLAKHTERKHSNRHQLQCDKFFTRRYSLHQHVRNIHEGAKKQYVCKVCKKAFHRAVDLIAHERTHTQEKPFQCSACGKALATKLSLKRHTLSHLKIKPFACIKCGRSFTRAQDVRKHKCNRAL